MLNVEVKPGFTNYQPELKYSRALSKIEEKQQNQLLNPKTDSENW